MYTNDNDPSFYKTRTGHVKQLLCNLGFHYLWRITDESGAHISAVRNTGLLIVWCLTPFSTVFQFCRGDQCTYTCFPGVFFNQFSAQYYFRGTGCFPT